MKLKKWILKFHVCAICIMLILCIVQLIYYKNIYWAVFYLVMGKLEQMTLLNMLGVKYAP